MLLANRHGFFSIWEQPKKGALYAMGVDTAAGVRGSDPCVIEVVDMETEAQVAEWYGWQPPHEFGKTVTMVSGLYDAEVAIETHPSPHGLAVFDAAEAAGCRKLFVQTQWNARESRFESRKGWIMSEQGKGSVLSRIAQALAENVPIRSERLLQELIDAQLDDNERVDRKCRNDCIMAYGIALKLADNARAEKLQQVEKIKPPPPSGSDEAFWAAYRAKRGLGAKRYDNFSGQGI